jgi:hypothetical protein
MMEGIGVEERKWEDGKFCDGKRVQKYIMRQSYQRDQDRRLLGEIRAFWI